MVEQCRLLGLAIDKHLLESLIVQKVVQPIESRLLQRKFQEASKATPGGKK